MDTIVQQFKSFEFNEKFNSYVITVGASIIAPGEVKKLSYQMFNENHSCPIDDIWERNNNIDTK